MWTILGVTAYSLLGGWLGLGGSGNQTDPDTEPAPSLWDNPLLLVLLAITLITVLALVFKK